MDVEDDNHQYRHTWNGFRICQATCQIFLYVACLTTEIDEKCIILEIGSQHIKHTRNVFGI